MTDASTPVIVTPPADSRPNAENVTASSNKVRVNASQAISSLRGGLLCYRTFVLNIPTHVYALSKKSSSKAYKFFPTPAMAIIVRKRFREFGVHLG